jgi:transposase
MQELYGGAMAGPRTHPDTIRAAELVLEGHPIGKIAEMMGLHRTTIKRAMNRLKKNKLDKKHNAS